MTATRVAIGVLALVLVLLIGLLVVSALATVLSIGDGDTCSGCDTQPGWAKTGLRVGPVGLFAWLIAAIVVWVRRNGDG